MSSSFQKFNSGIKIGSVADLTALGTITGMQKGSLIWVDSEQSFYQYNSTAWEPISAGSVSLTGQALLENHILVGDPLNDESIAVDTDALGDVQASTAAGLTIKANAVTESKIADDAVTQAKIANNAVGSDQLADNAVDTAAIQSGAVTNDKVAAGIDAAKIADGSVSNAEFQYLDGVTSSIQTQLNNKAAASHTHVAADITDFAAAAKAAAVADSISDGVTDVAPSQNAVFDALALKANSSELASTANGLGASLVGIEDAAAQFTSTNVEGALAEALDAAQAAQADATQALSDAGAAQAAANAAQADATQALADASAAQNAANTALNAANAAQADVDDLVTLSGVAVNAEDLGSFTGSVIPDASTIKAALQALETEVELKADDADVIKKDGSVAFTADQSMGGNKLTNVAAPTASSDAATKGYVDAVAEGLKPKAAVRAATTAAGTLASDFEAGDSIDGVTLAAGDRILIKNQGAPAQNGIYVVQASGAPVRATDFDSLSPIDEINGAMVAVQEGTENAGKVFVQTGVVTAIDSDAINFVFFNSSASLVGGDGITVSGSNISVDHDGEGLQFSAGQLALELDGSTLAKGASGLKVAALGITSAELAADAVTTAKIADANVTNAKLATGIDAAKIADGSVSNAEFQYLDGVTSSIQTQLDGKAASSHSHAISDVTGLQTALDGKADTALSNLASVAINTSLLPATYADLDLGSVAKPWQFAYLLQLRDLSNNISYEIADRNIKSSDGGYSVRGDLRRLQNASNADKLDWSGADLKVMATKMLRSDAANGTNFLEEQYIDAITLNANVASPTAIASLNTAHASFEGVEIHYKIKEATSNRVRIGRLMVVTNGTDVSITDGYNETAVLGAGDGIKFTAAINGANLEIRYQDTHATNAATMRCDVKRIRA